jgi:Ca2+-transporting ATPase
VGWDILWIGLLMAVVAFAVGYSAWDASTDEHHQSTWQTMIFTTLVCSQLSLALAVRSEHDSLLRLGLLTNKFLLGAVVLMFGLQLAVIYVPLLQSVFQTAPLTLTQLSLCCAASLIVLVAVEIEKLLGRRGSDRE